MLKKLAKFFKFVKNNQLYLTSGVTILPVTSLFWGFLEFEISFVHYQKEKYLLNGAFKM